MQINPIAKHHSNRVFPKRNNVSRHHQRSDVSSAVFSRVVDIAYLAYTSSPQ